MAAIMAAMGRYTQEGSLRYESDPAEVWAALLVAVEALYSIKPSASAYDRRRLAFSTGMTSSSWGEYVTATVENGTVVRLRGKRVHLAGVARRLGRAIPFAGR
jgi:hypothetical protein